MHPFELWFPPDRRIHLGVGLLGRMIAVFLVLRNIHIVLLSGCTNLHSQQQCRRVPFSAHCFQHLWFEIF